MTSTVSRYDLELKLAELKINGFVVFEDLIPVETIDRMYAAFLPLLENVRQRERDFSPVERGDIRTGQGRLQHPNRYTLNVPWMPPFAHPEVYENPVILEFLTQYWGTDNFDITCYHSNTPYPGSQYQHWHRDIGLLTPNIGLQICPHFGVKFPLVETAEENGSIEVFPGTQYLAHPELEGRYDDVMRRGDFATTRRLNLKKGSVWVQDPRTLHRGTPNRSTHPRPEVVLCYSRSWFAVNHLIEMTEAEFDKLSERGRKLLSRSRRNLHKSQ
ncbi:phytanoyl-CoA dioxygenase family protein [Candidatus Poribacteria bacterium]|nr:phytanoyl-CoA dioxygenase family protein [Candidatus Poribacteria bacterium]